MSSGGVSRNNQTRYARLTDSDFGWFVDSGNLTLALLGSIGYMIDKTPYRSFSETAKQIVSSIP